MRKPLFLCVVAGLLALPCVARAQFNIEVLAGSNLSGVVLFRGIACQNQATAGSIDDGGKFPLITGQARTDA